MFVGSFIPNIIMEDEDLSNLSKLIYGRLTQYAGPKGTCWPKEETLAFSVRRSVSQIHKCLLELEDKEFIVRVKPTGRDRLLHRSIRYHFLWKDEWDSLLEPDQTSDSEIDENARCAPSENTWSGTGENTRSNNKIEIRNRIIRNSSSKEEEMNPADSIVPPPNKIRLHRRSKSQIIKSKSSTQERNPTKEISPIEVPEPVQDIFDFWSEKGLRLPKRNPSKTLQRCITLVNKLLKGRLSSEDKHKYSPEEIKMTIERFSIAAFDNDFYPIGDRKEKLRHMYISDFIESMIRCNGELTRINPFKKYYNEPPTRITNILPDNPAFTFNLKKYYEKDVLGKVKPKYSTREENNFRKAAEKFLDFLQTNKSRIRGHIDDNQGAGILWKAIMKDAGDPRKINTGWLCSDETWNRRFPAYLNSQGFLLDYGDSGFNMYAPLQK
ncbi:MAG: helix-turn-helix domain-containing protein [Candidatus Colwellbacteria bacterium]|nr:helix-turn-helix domain-containing protein [Candidatus Colwellbacteria bacterium]